MIRMPCAVIAPGLEPNNSTADINDFRCAHGHSHEVALRITVKNMGVKFTGKLHECIGCSMAKGYRKPIKWTTDARAIS